MLVLGLGTGQLIHQHLHHSGAIEDSGSCSPLGSEVCLMGTVSWDFDRDFDDFVELSASF